MSQSILHALEQQFLDTHNAQIVTAVELEWYFGDDDLSVFSSQELEENSPPTLAEDIAMLTQIQAACEKESIPIEAITAERGIRQFEIATSLLASAEDGAVATDIIRTIIQDIGNKHGHNVHFGAKPFHDRPASGLHIHLSLHDSQNRANLFAKGRDEDETSLISYAMNGLCDTLEESMIIFAPNEDDYERYHHLTTEKMPTYAPTHISWGGNNRTTALRIPASTINPNQRHIEHRVPCPHADPFLTFACMILGLDHGLQHKSVQHTKIFGNAFDPQYDLTPLPNAIETAQEFYRNGANIAPRLRAIKQQLAKPA